MKIPVRGFSKSWGYHYKTEMILLTCMLFVIALCAGLVVAWHPMPSDTFKGSSTSSILSQNSGLHADNNEEGTLTTDFVPRSESAEWVVEPEDGTIEISDYNLPTGDMPLCITQAWLDQWWVKVRVYGGYEALCSSWEFKLEQKGVSWELIVEEYYHEDGACCSEDFYWYRLFMPAGCDKICFDANNYPEVALPWELKHDPQYTDLGKEINIEFKTLWEGCYLPEQQFTISSAHSMSVFVCIYLSKL
ncbi:MAG: hypothetical protein ACFFCT_02615 [Candidatus Odinarchaeota archaeon]